MINKGTFYKGWTGYKIDLSKAEENTNLIVSKDALRGNRFEYYLIDRDNKEFVFRSLSVFASDNNISSSTLSKLLKGEIEYRGWKLTRKDLKT